LAIAQAAGIPDGARVFGANQFWIRYDQGRLNEVIGRLEAAGRPNPMTSAVLGLALCELDRLHDARLLLDRFAQDLSVLPSNFARPYVLALLAQVCHAVGDTERARLLSDWLTPHQRLVIHIGSAGIGSGDHYLGLLAATRRRFDDAETHFASAAALHERMAAPTWLARTHLEWARMLLTRRQAGDVERARALLGRALATARELGLETVERRTTTLLQDCD
jgi:tetratricopeptide (TPR) repeat protein